jgi:hypothetical protein
MTETQRIFVTPSKLGSCFTCFRTDSPAVRYAVSLSALSELYLAGIADVEREGLFVSPNETLQAVEGFTLSRSAGIMTG